MTGWILFAFLIGWYLCVHLLAWYIVKKENPNHEKSK